jgi:putative membrane protein
MKKIIPAATTMLFAVCLTIISGCSSSLSYQQALNKNERKINGIDALQDAQFLVEAKSFNILEKSMSELAAEKGYSAELVKYAKRTLENHEDMEKQLNKLARKEKVILPAEMKAEHAQKLDDLKSSNRADFDTKFVEILEEINEDNTFLYEEKASAAHDADVRAFAARKLDVFRAHAKELDGVNDQLMQTHR